MDFKGTKGNWEYSKQKGTKNHCIQAQIWTDTQEEYIATLNSTEKENEANANAKLIAAAPELLKAAKLALEAFETYVIDSYIMTGTIAENRLREAIEKALK